MVNACGSVAIWKWGPSDRLQVTVISVPLMVDHLRRGILRTASYYLIADYRCQARPTLAEEHRSQSLAERVKTS